MVEDGAQLQVLTYVKGNILSKKCAWNLMSESKNLFK